MGGIFKVLLTHRVLYLKQFFKNKHVYHNQIYNVRISS